MNQGELLGPGGSGAGAASLSTRAQGQGQGQDATAPASTLRVSFCCADTDAEPWLQALRAALPEADISLWRSGAPLADYAVVWAPPQQFFDEQTALRAVFNTGAGVDALLRLNIAPTLPIIRLDDAGMATQMAEYVCHAVLRHLREMDAYAQAQTQGLWQQRAPLDRADLPVGILGMGVLGARVASALRQFEFPVLGWSRSPKQMEGVQSFSGMAELDAFLAATKVLVCLLPLTPDTRDLLDSARLARLQPGAYVINVARGALLVEDALLAHLHSGHLSGATLDVFRTEPLPTGHPFWSHPKICITPHISARTRLADSVAQIARKMRILEQGAPGCPVPGMVDRERGY